jgi:phage anti-repressor protein
MDLLEYLKKYTTISNTFINDFFSLYLLETNQSDYTVNLDTLSKWLKCDKINLKVTLLNSYRKNIDYTIKKQKSTGGRPSELIMLTPDCFKRLCMRSKTKKAEEVRTYFIELEKHLDKYKNYIIQSLNKKVGILENNQKTKQNINSGVIYIMKTDLDIEGIYKIGKTTKFKSRLATHNSLHVYDVEVLITEVEKCLKGLLISKQYRKRKKFYQVDLDILKELIQNCDCIN